MKALTISQPFASLIASGEKWVENRTWLTDYRGPLAIHAGKGTQYLTRCELAAYPTGCVIAVVDLLSCIDLAHAHRCLRRGWPLKQRGRYARAQEEKVRALLEHEHTEGPICWVLDNPRQVDPAVEIAGQRGLWDLPADLGAKVIGRAEDIPL